MSTFQLFITTHCHLCEEAKKVLEQVYPPITPLTTEIVDDERLMELYGLRIPVLKRLDNSTELDWPFTIKEVIKFIA